MDFNNLKLICKNELLENIIPFWLERSQDNEYGGYFSCLDRKGNVYDTDKFIWLQGRQVWFFSMICNTIEKRDEWLDCAVQGAEFLKKYGHDGNYNWYFSLTREGKPLIQPYNIFSDCFATMAFGQLSRATGRDEYALIAEKTFNNILRREDNPKGQYNKTVNGTRPLKNFSLPMILCNLSLELEHLLDKEVVERTIDNCLHEVLEIFYQPELGLIVENVTPEGGLSDSFEGRLLAPGHAIEAMWFVMDLGIKLQRRDLIEKAIGITLKTLDMAWDKQHGGLFYFLDRKGYPPQQLEWDQKLWWVHIESLITTVKGYMLTGSQECSKWAEKIHNYTWNRFRDTDYPEWFGYLNRQGEVLLPLKGGKWKGCFHVPRGLYQIWNTIETYNI